MPDISIDDRGHWDSPRFKARIAGVFYLLTFVAGSIELLSASVRLPANLAADACYLGVTVLFYQIFKPVHQPVSLLAAFFSILGIIAGALNAVHISPIAINPLGFFGFYCLLIGYLIIRSTFLPRVLGVLMAIGGLGWLTFFSPTFATSLYPYNLSPGIIGEGALTLWLLIFGLNEQRWNEQARM
jgi:hypothetical protein